jgi:hypothetical protein
VTDAIRLGDLVGLDDGMLAMVVGLDSAGRWIVRDEYNTERTVANVYRVVA